MEYVKGRELIEFENMTNNWRGNYEMVDEMVLTKTINTDFTDKIIVHDRFVEVDSRFSKEEILKELSEFSNKEYIEVSIWKGITLEKDWARVSEIRDTLKEGFQKPLVILGVRLRVEMYNY